RGGPEAWPAIGDIKLEVGTIGSSSVDGQKLVTAADIGNYDVTPIDIADPAALKSSLDSFGESFGTLDGNNRVLTNIDYDLSGLNSNSTIRSMLASAGYDLDNLMPKSGGTGASLDLNDHRGSDEIYGTSGDDTFTVGDHVSVITNNAGNDT